MKKKLDRKKLGEHHVTLATVTSFWGYFKIVFSFLIIQRNSIKISL